MGVLLNHGFPGSVRSQASRIATFSDNYVSFQGCNFVWNCMRVCHNLFWLDKKLAGCIDLVRTCRSLCAQRGHWHHPLQTEDVQMGMKLFGKKGCDFSESWPLLTSLQHPRYLPRNAETYCNCIKANENSMHLETQNIYHQNFFQKTNFIHVYPLFIRYFNGFLEVPNFILLFGQARREPEPTWPIPMNPSIWKNRSQRRCPMKLGAARKRRNFNV